MGEEDEMEKGGLPQDLNKAPGDHSGRRGGSRLPFVPNNELVGVNIPQIGDIVGPFFFIATYW